MKKDTEKLFSEVLPLIPQVIPESFGDDIRDELSGLGDIMIYRTGTQNVKGNRKRVVRGLCTACKGESIFEYKSIGFGCSRVVLSSDSYGFYVSDIDRRIVKTYEKVDCPKCGAQLHARCISSFSEVVECANICVVTVHNVRGNLCVLSWILRKLSDREGNISFLSVKQDGIIVVNKEAIRLSGGQNYYYSFSEYLHWKKRSAEGRFISMQNHLIFGCTREAVEATSAANSALDVFVRQKGGIFIMAYLEAWCKFPQIENLVRQGFSRLLNSMLDECCVFYGGYTEKCKVEVKQLKNALALEYVRPCEMLGVGKEYLDICRGFDLKEYYCFRYGLSKRIVLTREQIKVMKELGLSDFKGWIDKDRYGHKFRIVHLLNYMKKQRDAADKNGKHGVVKLIYLRDYYEALLNAYGEVPESMLFPSDLIKAHNAAIRLVDEKIDTEIDECIRARFAELKEYSFTDEDSGLLLRPCASHAELIKEGKLLEHCVARYAGRHSKGETTIFFIRRIKEPDEPFYTLEYRNGAIVQDHGYDNKTQTSEIYAFEKKWLKFIHEREIGYAKGNTELITANAGA